jgi:hypothetical protein
VNISSDAGRLPVRLTSPASAASVRGGEVAFFDCGDCVTAQPTDTISRCKELQQPNQDNAQQSDQVWMGIS